MIKDRRMRVGRAWDENEQKTTGRWELYVDPDDWWVGVYLQRRKPEPGVVGKGRVDVVYVCPLPCVVIRVARPPYDRAPASHLVSVVLLVGIVCALTVAYMAGQAGWGWS